jgi:hypothetical protein
MMGLVLSASQKPNKPKPRGRKFLIRFKLVSTFFSVLFFLSSSITTLDQDFGEHIYRTRLKHIYSKNKISVAECGMDQISREKCLQLVFFSGPTLEF